MDGLELMMALMRKDMGVRTNVPPGAAACLGIRHTGQLLQCVAQRPETSEQAVTCWHNTGAHSQRARAVDAQLPPIRLRPKKVQMCKAARHSRFSHVQPLAGSEAQDREAAAAGVNLEDEAYLRKTADKLPDLGRKFEYLLNTVGQ